MKDIYIEKEREISVIADVDVLVCGGGPAGVGAAIRAARLGVSVMVVEMLDCLGGMATSGMMSHYTGDSSSSVMREIFIHRRQQIGRCCRENKAIFAEKFQNYLHENHIDEKARAETIPLNHWINASKQIFSNLP